MLEDIMQFTHISDAEDNKVTSVEFNSLHVGDIINHFAEFLRAVGFDYMQVNEVKDGVWVFDKDYNQPVAKKSSYEDTYHTYDDYVDDAVYEDDEDTYNASDEFPVGSIVRCISDKHTDARRVFGLMGIVEEVKDWSPFDQTLRVRFTPKAPETQPINWWVSPECLELFLAP